MLERTNTPVNLLDVMTELELLDVSFIDGGDEWIKVTDRKTLYRAAIVALIEAAETEGFVVTDGSFDSEPITEIEVEDAPEGYCPGLDNGCTCESCTEQIIDSVGMDRGEWGINEDTRR